MPVPWLDGRGPYGQQYTETVKPKQGEFADLVVRTGQSELVQGAVVGAHVEAEATLTVQGALTGVCVSTVSF
jgi:hypothetical protein